MKTDYQKSKCYAWERLVVAPNDKTMVHITNAQKLVDLVWKEQGLLFPPQVIDIHKNNSTAAATANRMEIQMQQAVPTWVLLHEIAHSMTSNLWGDRTGHDKSWMGIYMKLIEKYIGIPMLILTATASKENINFDITASPIFLD